jgi:4-hydroxybenzoate polyprenyltransferase
MNKTDIKQNSFLYKSPLFFHPFIKLMRLDRPIGFWLLFFPCLWGLLISSNNIFQILTLKYTLFFFIGSVIMRGAGCVLNDIIDAEFDKKVERTSLRPIPNGDISKKSALLFMIFLLLIGLIILLSFNQTTVLLGVCSSLLIITYPYMKRITFYPQLWLGITFNWGFLMGTTSIKGFFPTDNIFFYIALIFWTLGYDTIYAHQDKEDDKIIGVKSTALKFANNTKTFLSIFYAITISFILLSIYLQIDLNYYYILIIMPAYHLFKQVFTLDINKPDNCLNKFKSNFNFGILLSIFIILTKLNI